MTVRAIILAMIGAIFIATVGYFNDQVPRLNHFVGNQFPIVVFFPLILFAAVINPLLRRARPRWVLSPAEIAVVTALLLAACNIPGSGFMRWWSRMAAVPSVASTHELTWGKTSALGYVPAELLFNDGRYDSTICDSFISGNGGSEIALDQLPWWSWQGPMAGWIPLALLFAGASICMALIVHRPWSTQERLPYPVAQVAGAFIQSPREIFASRLFWIGAVSIFVLHIGNGTYNWLTGASPRDVFAWDFSEPFQKTFPAFWAAISQVPWGGNSVLYFPIYPTLVAFACFVAADVSLSVGLTVVAWSLAGFVLVWANVKFEWVAIEGGVGPWQSAGSCIALALAMAYFGRRHYWNLLRRAFAVGGHGVLGHEVWAARMLLLCTAGLTAILAAYGVAWPLALLGVLLVLLAYIVVARITVESGVFLVQLQWLPVAVVLGLLGANATGLKAVAVLGMVSFVFCAEVRECLTPLVLNGLRIADPTRTRPGRLGAMSMVVLVIALAAAVPFGLWVDHNFGVKDGESFSQAAPGYLFNAVARASGDLAAAKQLETSAALGAFERLAAAKPDPRCLWAMAAGAVIVLGLVWLRLRLTWWPIHPILFLVWGTWAMRVAAFSFLLGWAIKAVCARAGVRFASLKMLMIGVIAGDLAGGVVWMIVGAINFAITHKTPLRYHVFPGG
ncbi:MAG: hypothetical protein LLG01_03000 [Planctomycetaceae bacterium]|nr:hypothetical protein [Planctomycetaceae bacterium]